MKKLVSILTVISALMFCACSALPSADDYIAVLYRPYEAKAMITEDGVEYTADVTLGEDGRLDIVFSTPALLTGIGYGFSQDDSYIIYNETNIPLQDNSLRDKIASGVYEWKKLLLPTGDFSVGRTFDDETNYIVLTGGGAEYYFDEETKNPVMILTETTDIVFTEFTPYDSTPESTGGN